MGSSSSTPTTQQTSSNLDPLKLHKEYVDEKVKDNKIVIFSKTSCGYCDMAKELFKTIGASYQTVELDMSQSCPSNDCLSLVKALITRTGMRTVPQIFINGKIVGGYTEVAALHEQGKLKEMLNK
jgi:glutaredoxin 3